ncbi:hypothetical protein [Microcoleus sp. Pol17_C1]
MKLPAYALYIERLPETSRSPKPSKNLQIQQISFRRQTGKESAAVLLG